MKALLLNIFKGRHILKTMVMKDIKARYTGSILGPLWMIATPLYQMLLYTFLFSIILKVRFDTGEGTSSFVVYLLAGLIPWIFFSEATLKGSSVFIENAHIIKKVKFPLEICVASVILSSMSTFFIYLFFYLAALVFFGLLKFHTAPLIIFPLIIQVLLISGLSFGLGSIAVFFRDINQAIGMILNILFFLMPIVYPSAAIPERLRWIFDINPFYFIVEMYRAFLIQGKIPEMFPVLYPLLFSLFIFFAGYYIFSKTRDAFKDVL
jgi:lipopolysaccharide transport system permease protein